MDLRMILSVLVVALVGGVGVWLLLPDPVDDDGTRLPWRAELDGRGRLQVFGFTLGETTLAEVQRTFDDKGELTLFARPAPAEPYAAEAYFEQVYLSRLRANFIVTLAAGQETLAEMFQRGLRISRLGDGTQKVRLTPADEESLGRMPIAHITYLPMARLDADLIASRFGEPDERIAEPNGVEHWLYPRRGLDIARDPRGRVVIQYLDPADFEQVRSPLRAAAVDS